ncbi:hypothetical protein CcaverHIS002_0701380 [Cutaneotrichosporon cavernicola]|nr:hypothetical protein CcaverHIS002_0701380 [Cutaneotrichosporon cavernicola]BEJ10103.1 hypothetical protein CcaverHIS641_0701380 [Cutaneotrichosporon cavernicola]
MNFSPYQPPPDQHADEDTGFGRKANKGKKPWFSRDSSYSSYQAGGSTSDPTVQAQAYSNDVESQAYAYGNGGHSGASASEDRVNAWESRFGWRIDMMAAAAYLGGPLSALLLLILETQNDYVRFHAYQSALLTTPILTFILITNLLLPFPAFLKTLIVLAGVGAALYSAYRAYKDAQEGLNRYWLPYIGEYAERRVDVKMISHIRRLGASNTRRSLMGGTVLFLLLLLFIVQYNRPLWSPWATSSNIPDIRSPSAVPPSRFPTVNGANILGKLPQPLAPKAGMRVPNVVHYVYGLKPVRNGEQVPPLPYYAYLGMRSALVNLKPDKIYFHYQNEPTGPWWDLIKPHLTLIKVKAPDTIYGREVNHFAHKADLVRLWVLERMGGIYLDIDMFIVRDFDDLLYASTTMGMEASPDSRRTEMQPTGLCNGVIIAEPHAPFIKNWLKTYVTFNGDNWAGHSVDKPWELAQLFPDQIQVLNSKAMFWPLWSGDEIKIVHTEDGYDWSKQYSYHAWESLAMGYLSNLNPRDIRTKSTSFHRLVRPAVGPTDEEVYSRLD